MKLNELLKDIEYKVLQGNAEVEITGIAYDSRKVKPGNLFVCMSGFASDGHGFINKAFEMGAVAALVEKDMEGCHEALKKKAEADGFTPEYIPYAMNIIRIKDARRVLALISAAYFGNPASKMTMIGLTGTKGKTTTSHMIKSILEAAGHKVGMIGTMGAVIDSEHVETKNTTPESYELHSLFDRMVKAGCTYCVMEVSSQAFKLERCYGIRYDYGAFLNISPDHIGPGEHADFEEYLNYKKQIFAQSDNAIINIDDEHARAIAGAGVVSPTMYTVGICDDEGGIAPDLGAYEIRDIWEPDILGSSMKTKGMLEGEFVIPMPGHFNVENALVATCICHLCGVDKEAILRGLRATTVKGRTQVVREASHIATFIIDYAHNALSMESLLSMLKGYKPDRLICLFGGGGNKPKQRRYDMGEAAGRYADLTILTEDNPRYEEISDINADIIVGLDVHQGKYEIILDRKEAIEHLLDTAGKRDIVALIGKGHETYQDVKGVKTYFCEEEIIKAYVKAHK